LLPDFFPLCLQGGLALAFALGGQLLLPALAGRFPLRRLLSLALRLITAFAQGRGINDDRLDGQRLQARRPKGAPFQGAQHHENRRQYMHAERQTQSPGLRPQLLHAYSPNPASSGSLISPTLVTPAFCSNTMAL